MIEDVLAQPHQIADALWRVDAAGIERRDRPGGLVVFGMGGSAIGGDLAAAAIGDRATAPVRTVRGYATEPWLAPDTLALCASYSGDTEETLSVFAAAGQAGVERVALTTGGALAAHAREAGVPVIGVPSGMQPRAAVIYMAVAALRCAAAAGAAPDLTGEIEDAGDLLGELVEQWRDGGEPAELAAALDGRTPVVHGAGLTAPAAYRWKTQINENAKLAAFASVLPEANHNEIEGWRWGAEHARLAGVFLTAAGLHPRVERRFERLRTAIGEAGAPVVEARARGETPVARLLSLVLLGDIVSVRLAERAGVDPTPVDAIDRFKRSLDG